MFKKYFLIVLFIIFCFSFEKGNTSAFQRLEQNAAYLGSAYAGTATLAEDASTEFFNAAGLSYLQCEEMVFSGVFDDLKFHFNASNAAPFSTSQGVSSLGGGEFVSKSQIFVPTFHFFKRINSCLTFGFGITQPFGFKTNYNDRSLARYLSGHTFFRTYDVSPSLAFQWDECFSIGFGLDFLYADFRIAKALGFGFLLDSSSPDGFLDNRLEDWCTGWHVGFIYQYCDWGTRVGMQYRTAFRMDLDGESFGGVQSIAGGTPVLQGVSACITLPDTLVFSAQQTLCDCWTLLFDLQWTRWNRWDNLILDYDDHTKEITEFHYKNTFRVALGVNYQWDPCLLLRAGVAYDESPVRRTFFSTRIPDSNQVWLAVGAGFRLTRCIGIDIGYAHVFFDDLDGFNELAPIVTHPGANIQQGMQFLQATGRAKSDIIGVQLTFDTL